MGISAARAITVGGVVTRWRRRQPKPIVLRYGLAALLVGLALTLTLTFQVFETDRPTLFLFFAAIVASAWFGGVGPGCVAVVLSVPAGLYFYSTRLMAFTITLDNSLLFLFFTVCAMAGGAISSRQRVAEERLQRAHRQLQLKAEELEGINAALREEMSERRRTESALHETQMELTRVARLTTMGELVASIAHEINQPLAAITTTAASCLRWLEGDRPNLREAREAATRLVRDGERAGEVIRYVRAMARRSVAEQVAVDVNAAISDAVSLASHELRKNQIDLLMELVGDEMIVLGDRIQLQQVFLNLIMNAIESLCTITNRVRTLRIQSRLGERGLVKVIIEDHGAGIPQNILDSLFDAFVTTKTEGMGLGLSICRSILDAHGGAVEAHARAPFGAVLSVTLPVKGNAR